MLSRLHFALFLPLAALLACAVPSKTTTPTNPTSPLTGNWDNWQIQAGTAITSPPPSTNLYFVGAIQTQGTQATGVFTSPTQTGTQVFDFTVGSYTSASQAIELITNGYAIDFMEPSTPDTIVPVAVTGGCVGYPPPACLAIFTVPSVGVQIAPLTGTYIGTLTAANAPNLSGTATVTLTQSSTPNSDGSFPLGGTVTFPADSGFGSDPISGTIIGEAITVYDPTPGIVPVVSLAASTNPAATQITVSNLAFARTASSIVTYTGTLTRQ